MKRITKFRQKREDKVISLSETKSVKGGIREFLEKNTGRAENHARYRKACREAESIMLVTIGSKEYFCIDW